VKKIALVLAGVKRLQQFEAAVDFAHPSVVAGCDQVVFAQEFGEYAILVFGGKVDRLDVDADHVGYAGRVQPVSAGRAEVVVVVIFPVLHEQANDFVALLL